MISNHFLGKRAAAEIFKKGVKCFVPTVSVDSRRAALWFRIFEITLASMASISSVSVSVPTWSI
jgi:hypothetical protein